MQKKRLNLAIILAGSGMLFLTTSVATVQVAKADTVTCGANFPGGIGWINGSGGIDGNFCNATATYGDTTFTSSLRLEQRSVGPIASSGTTYTLPAGEVGNIDYGETVSGGVLDNATYTFEFSDVTAGGPTLTYNPDGFDDVYYGPSGRTTTQNDSTNWVFVNSEQIIELALLGGIDYTAGDLLKVDLITTVDSDEHFDNAIYVQTTAAAPEPGTIGMMFAGFGLVGLGVIQRRRSANAKEGRQN